MISAPRTPRFDSRRPFAGRTEASPSRIASRSAPAAIAAAAAAPALNALCVPASARSISALPTGVSSVTWVLPAPDRARTRTSASAPAPNEMQRRGRASPRHSSAKASSALTTAAASPGRPSNSSPFARATPSTLPNPSRCAGAHWVITPTDGRARAVSDAISPRWFAPSSTTALRCPASRPQSVSGTPISLLRLPRVAETGPRVPRIAATISLTVVLPLLPVMPTRTRSRKRLLHAAASSPSARTESPT